VLLTVNHWSYIQFDTYAMRSILEAMFKGKSIVGNDSKYHNDYFLQGNGGEPFYGDNEHAYVNVKLYPTDDWASQHPKRKSSGGKANRS
jgi:hypothetical protein